MIGFVAAVLDKVFIPKKKKEKKGCLFVHIYLHKHAKFDRYPCKVGVCVRGSENLIYLHYFFSRAATQTSAIVPFHIFAGLYMYKIFFKKNPSFYLGFAFL